MTQSYRHPLLLVLACCLLLCATVAYLIGDAQSNSERQEGILREQKNFRDRDERAIADRAILHEQKTKLSESRAEITRQSAVTRELIQRLDELTKLVEALRVQLEKLASSRRE